MMQIMFIKTSQLERNRTQKEGFIELNIFNFRLQYTHKYGLQPLNKYFTLLLSQNTKLEEKKTTRTEPNLFSNRYICRENIFTLRTVDTKIKFFFFVSEKLSEDKQKPDGASLLIFCSSVTVSPRKCNNIVSVVGAVPQHCSPQGLSSQWGLFIRNTTYQDVVYQAW